MADYRVFSDILSIKAASLSAERRQLILEEIAANTRLQASAAQAQAAAAEAQALAVAAKAKAEAARVRAEVMSALIDKKLAADIAELDARKSAKTTRTTQHQNSERPDAALLHVVMPPIEDQLADPVPLPVVPLTNGIAAVPAAPQVLPPRVLGPLGARDARHATFTDGATGAAISTGLAGKLGLSEKVLVPKSDFKNKPLGARKLNCPVHLAPSVKALVDLSKHVLDSFHNFKKLCNCIFNSEPCLIIGHVKYKPISCCRSEKREPDVTSLGSMHESPVSDVTLPCMPLSSRACCFDPIIYPPARPPSNLRAPVVERYRRSAHQLDPLCDSMGVSAQPRRSLGDVHGPTVRWIIQIGLLNFVTVTMCTAPTRTL